MRILLSLFIFIFLYQTVAYPAESPFLEEISGVLTVEAASQEAGADRLVLNKCQLTIAAIGRGTAEEIIIENEAPGKIGNLLFKNVLFPGFAARAIQFTGLEGNFGALLPALPLLIKIQALAYGAPEELPEYLPKLRAFLPALKKFHIERFQVDNLQIKNGDINLAIGSLVENDCAMTHVGQSQLNGLTVSSGAVILLTADGVGFNRTESPDIEAMLALDAQKLENGLLRGDDLASLANLSIDGLFVKNMKIPAFGISLAEFTLDLHVLQNKLDTALAFHELAVPGAILEMLELLNVPQTVYVGGEFALNAKFDGDNITANHSLKVGGAQLCQIASSGIVKYGGRKDELSLANLYVNFVNQGLIAMIPQVYKSKILSDLERQMPPFANAVQQVLSGQANTLSIKVDDTRNSDSIEIEAQ